MRHSRKGIKLSRQNTSSIPGSLAISFLQSLTSVVQNSGISEQKLFAQAGLVIDQTKDSHQRISGDEYCRLLDMAAKVCKDPNFGLHVGQAIKPGHYGVLGYACMSSKTLDEVLNRMQRYQTLVSDIGVNRFELKDENVKIRFDCDVQPYPPRQLSEEHLAGMVTFSRWIKQEDNSPEKIHFQHPEPEDTSEHQSIFNCPVLFSQAETAIYYASKYLTDPLPMAAPDVSKMMDGYAKKLLENMPEGEGFHEQASKALVILLQDGKPSLERLSKQLNIDVNTLKSRLKAEDISYQNLLDTSRRTLALTYIAQSSLSLTDIAFLLGFSEQSAFQRAFKRWTGETPMRHRKTLSDN